MSQEIISHFKEKPKTKIAWWVMGLGLATFLVPPFLGIFTAVIRPMIDEASSENIGAAVGFGAAALALGLSVAALVIGRRAFKQGERSWVLWLGFIPAMLIGAFWVLMIVGEFIFPH